MQCYVICSDSDGAVVENIKRKDEQARTMFDEIVRHYAPLMSVGSTCRSEMDYRPQVTLEFPQWLKSIA